MQLRMPARRHPAAVSLLGGVGEVLQPNLPAQKLNRSNFIHKQKVKYFDTLTPRRRISVSQILNALGASIEV